MGGILWAIIVVLIVCWVLGLVFHIFGALIHIALIVAVILIILKLIRGSGPRS